MLHYRPAVSSELLTVEHDRVPGRLRLRAPALRGSSPRAAALAEALRTALREVRLDLRPTTGSILIRLDAGAAAEDIVDRARRVLETPPPAPQRSERARIEIGTRPPVQAGAKPRPAARPGAGIVTDWHALEPNTLLSLMGVGAAEGLTEDAARDRLARFGPNTLSRRAPASKFALFAKQFNSLPVKLLFGSMAVSGATGGFSDAAATLAVVALNGVLGFVTEGQAERTISRITLARHEDATVIRDGVARAVPREAVVPGDLLELSPGAEVAADARILSAEDLMIDESALTGESFPIGKRPVDALPAATPLAERCNMAHAGTLVAAGAGRALVVASGDRTEAAQVQLLSEGSVRPRALIEQDLEVLGARLAKYSLMACGLFFGIGFYRGYGAAVMLREALSLAVAAVPEGLPTVATTTLALGLRRMEREGILIRSLDVVESLGELQTLCLDKTGTLTENRMQVFAAVTAQGRHEPPTPGLDGDCALRSLAEIAALNNDAILRDGAPLADGASGTELALMRFAIEAGVDVATLRAARPRVETVERSSSRRFMSTLHTGADGARVTLVKGAPEDVQALCVRQRAIDGDRPLQDADREALRAENRALSLRQARVLAFAEGDAAPDGDGEPQGLTWLGMVAMADPIRPGARAFIKALHGAGIETVLITGDQAATAEAVARDLDMSDGAPLRVVDASHIEALDPELLAGLAAGAHVFARVNPRQKLLIVRALQTSGRVVGMTGDGVNDGPALKAAHVGIAMGASGTDLAREVANVVIRDDDLPTLIKAIEQGRAIYRNIRRSIEFLVVTNLSEIIVEMIEAAHGPGEIETPLELLWINLATDVAPAIGLALADPDPDAMRSPPRDRGESIIPRADLRRMGADSAVIAASALAVHFLGMARYGPGPQTRGMTFLTLSLGQLLYTLGCQRSDPRGLRLGRLLENRTLDAALLASIGFTALPFLSPAIGRLLRITPPGAGDLAIAVGASTAPLVRVLLRRGLRFGDEITREAS